MEKEITKSFDFSQLLSTAVKLPLVHISREQFLKRELIRYCDDEIVQCAIEHNPAYAGISSRIIDRIADKCISFETTKVSAISFAVGIPGGFAMLATIPTDLVQFYSHVLIIMQKLAYLYGWDELVGEDGEMDDETNHLLILFTGVMFGVSSVSVVVEKIAEQMATKVAKDLPRKALTKTIVYPIVKKVATLLGFKMTKDIFAKGISKVIPIVGGVVSGGLSFASYMPMAKRFKKYLSGLKTADVNYYKNLREGVVQEIEAEYADVGFKEINEELEQEIIEESQNEESENHDDLKQEAESEQVEEVTKKIDI